MGSTIVLLCGAMIPKVVRYVNAQLRDRKKGRVLPGSGMEPDHFMAMKNKGAVTDNAGFCVMRDYEKEPYGLSG